MHSILEKVLKGELNVEDASQYYVEHFDDNVFYETKQNIMDKTYEACADYFASVDFDWLKDFEILGVDRIRALGCNLGRVNKELGIKTFSLDDLNLDIYQEFSEGDTVSSSEIKEKLAVIYEEYGFKKAPKTADLKYWFDVESTQYRVGAKRYRGLRLNKKLR